MKNFKTLSAFFFLFSISLFVACESDADFASTASNGSNGTNSSYARMLTVGDFIYAVNLNEIVTFDATVPSDPTEIDRQDIGTGIETIFHHEGILLVGSSEGTFTYTIESTGIPRRRGQFDYNTLSLPVLPCDPVVASGNVAYATLYTTAEVEGSCRREQEVNLLVVMDITDLENPSLITTVETWSPRGLAIEGDLLFVCNEFLGLTVFDVSDPSRPRTINQERDLVAYDVIVKDDILIVVGGTELIQFDYSDPSNLVRLSTIQMK